MADDGHTINVGPVTIGEALARPTVADLDLDAIADRRAKHPIDAGPIVTYGERAALVAAVRWAQELVAVFSDSRALNSDEVDAALNGLDEALAPFKADR